MSEVHRSPLNRIAPFALAWLFAFASHAAMILLFANWTPLSDQWDSEGFLLIRPWLEGELTLSQLFSAHNEHRIFSKRLFDLAVLTLNGNHWDNRVFALANTAIYATAVALCFAFVARTTSGATKRVLQFAVLVMPLLTTSFENTLWGFQSPFYFSCLFTILALRHVALSPTLPYFGLPLALASAAAILSLASGLLLPLALVALLALDRRGGCSTARRVGVIALLLAVAVAGYVVLPKLPPENTVMARSVGEAALGTLRMLSWPIPLLPLAWLPLLFWFVSTTKHRRVLDSADLFFLGLAGWVVLQALATGYGRGQGLVAIPWRYTDALAFGLVANAYFACRLVAEQPTRARWRGAMAATGIAWTITGAYLALASAQGGYVILQTFRGWQARELVLASLLRNEAAAADNPMLPYPHLSKMPLFLGSASLKKALGVDGDRLRGACELDTDAYLSRIVCAFGTALPQLPLPQFIDVGFPQSSGPPSRCNIDYLGGRAANGNITRGSPLRIDGWAGPAGPRRLPMFGKAAVLLVGDGRTYAASIDIAIPRDDVAAFVADPRYRWSGFTLYAGTAHVEPGGYVVYLLTDAAAPCRTDQILHIP